VTLSTTESPSEVQGVTRSQKCDRECDPLEEVKDAVVYLNARRDYLDRWELGFIGSMVFIVLSKTNGDRARHLTPDMVGKLFETKAKVEALEARDKAEAEYDRVQRHFSDINKPGHVWCDLCEKNKRERAQAEIDRVELEKRDAEILAQTRLQAIAEGRIDEHGNRLEVTRIERNPLTAVRYREMARKRLAARNAATPGAENGRPTDA
jgi:DNA helicase HerA-like ATPase